MCAFSATTHAYGDLESEGFIYTVQGHGCFVKDNTNLVRKQFPGFALKNVSFNVPQELCCGFVSSNGAGKTTTLKSIMGMIHKDEGEIRIFGKPDNDVTVKEDIGIMFKQPYFQEDWTPLDIEKGMKLFYPAGMKGNIVNPYCYLNWSYEEFVDSIQAIIMINKKIDLYLPFSILQYKL